MENVIKTPSKTDSELVNDVDELSKNLETYWELRGMDLEKRFNEVWWKLLRQRLGNRVWCDECKKLGAPEDFSYVIINVKDTVLVCGHGGALKGVDTKAKILCPGCLGVVLKDPNVSLKEKVDDPVRRQELIERGCFRLPSDYWGFPLKSLNMPPNIVEQMKRQLQTY